MPSVLPSHAVRTQAETCLPLLQHLESAVAQGHPLDRFLARYYRQHREFGSRDRRFFSALAFAWFRWRGWLATPSQPDALNCVLAWRLDAAERHPAIEWLAGRLPPCSAPTDALGTTLLEAKARMLGQWRQGPPADSASLVPAWFAKALFYPVGADRTEHRRRCLQAFQIRPPTWLRIQTGHEPIVLAKLNELLIAHKRRGFPDLCRGVPITPQGGYRDCAHERNWPRRAQHPATPERFVEARAAPLPPEAEQPKIRSDQVSIATPHPRLPQAIRLPGGISLEELEKMPAVEIQDLASQCVGLVCAPNPGEHWWDACAGAGGKSLHLADRLRDTGSILATDIRAGILRECRRRMARNRAPTIIALRTWNGFAATAPERRFDGVLLDAPCSGIGAWHRNPDARWRTAPDTVPRHAELQSGLLRTCAEKTRPGGRLVYSVCTLAAAETVGVVEGFLAEQQDFSLAATPHPLTREPTGGLLWIWPWEGDCNGMFIAAMRKQG